MKLQYQTYWQTSDRVGTPDPPGEPRLEWIRGFYADMYQSTGGVPAPSDVMDGCYYNYPAAVLQGQLAPELSEPG